MFGFLRNLFRYSGASKTYVVTWSFGTAYPEDKSFLAPHLDFLLQSNGTRSWFYQDASRSISVFEDEEEATGKVLQVHCTNAESRQLFKEVCAWIERKGAAEYRRRDT